MPVKGLVLRPESSVAERVTFDDTGSGTSMLTQLQQIIGGYVETVPVGEGTLYLDEEGKLKGQVMNLAANELLAVAGTRLQPGDVIVGTVVLLGPADDEGWDTDVTPELEALVAEAGIEVQ